MNRDTIEFPDFKKYFIDQPDGFFPVYSAFQEDGNSNHLRVLEMDMICEWRLSDGKVKFVRVPFETEGQFNQLVEYLRVTAALLNKAILDRVGKLSFADTQPE